MKWLYSITISLLALTLSSCDIFPEPSSLAKIKASGELVVITRIGATTYYHDAQGNPTGFEYELVKRFADHLGVKLKVVTPPFFTDIIPMIARGDAHLAAAGLTVTDERKKLVRFGPRYQQITQQVVYRLGGDRPRNVADLVNGDIEILAGSSHAERMKALKEEYPELTWRETNEMESEELLTFVWDQMIDYTIADSNEVAVNQRFYPELRVAFDITEPQSLSWAFPLDVQDDSLYNEVVQFFGKMLSNGQLAQLTERYYGHTDQFDYVGTRKFIDHYYHRLVQYKDNFELAAESNDIDWRLLAAMGYQESHWNPRAVSPTGVRGIMMLTLDTALQLGIKNRINPEQSIFGGARYFKSLKERIPERIQEPDRTWMAVAAYNVGLGHLEDARIITQRRGYDPDKWVYVKESLPLLRKKTWYKRTKHGYARGQEPVVYVRNIRNYFDMLVRIDEAEKEQQDEPPPPPVNHFNFTPQAI